MTAQHAQRRNYYRDLAADYSRPGLVSPEMQRRMIDDAVRFIALKEATPPPVGPDYTLEQIERENREWWPTHCEALRQGRGDLLAQEYAESLVYLCQDGPFYGRTAGTQREAGWWAILAQPGVTMAWPIVMFHGEVVYFEWKCEDDETGETIAKGNVTWLRRGHRGAAYVKCEQLTFYRDVMGSPELMALVTREGSDKAA
jgi:hypothetical protein